MTGDLDAFFSAVTEKPAILYFKPIPVNSQPYMLVNMQVRFFTHICQKMVKNGFNQKACEFGLFFIFYDNI